MGGPFSFTSFFLPSLFFLTSSPPPSFSVFLYVRGRRIFRSTDVPFYGFSLTSFLLPPFRVFLCVIRGGRFLFLFRRGDCSFFFGIFFCLFFRFRAGLSGEVLHGFTGFQWIPPGFIEPCRPFQRLTALFFFGWLFFVNSPADRPLRRWFTQVCTVHRKRPFDLVKPSENPDRLSWN